MPGILRPGGRLLTKKPTAQDMFTGKGGRARIIPTDPHHAGNGFRFGA